MWGIAAHSYDSVIIFLAIFAPPTLPGLHALLPLQGAVIGESRLQVSLFSATLHSPEIASLSARICQHPTWVDLKVRALLVIRVGAVDILRLCVCV